MACGAAGFRWCLAVIAAAAVTGCAVYEMRESYSVDTLAAAKVSGFSGVRYWADTSTPQFEKAIAKRAEQERASSGGKPFEFNALALSGGADDGAFGAGYLIGWTERGDRPQFNIVTGVSTGALIAPLAFLGPARDGDLQRAFTQVNAAEIFEANGLISVLTGESLTSTEPLQKLVARYVDQHLVDAIAAEHAKGRRLRVLTTNLDAQRPIAWDLGEIATHGGTKALKLIREVVVASASVPGVFPPVMIEAVVDGKPIREMHVDGGTTNNVFLIPANTPINKVYWSNGKAAAHFYVLFNGRLDAEFEMVERSTFQIAKRAISTLIKAHGQSSVRELRTLVEREGGVFKLASIGPDFTAKSPAPFTQSYMVQLFDHGRAAGRRASWR